MAKWKNMQHLLILFLSIMMLVLAGCGSAGNTPPADQTTGDSSPSEDAQAENPQDASDETGAADSKLAENDAFRIRQPAPGAVVGMTLKLEGESRTFEGNFQYTVEDGHDILAEGVVQTSAGAPEWASFSTEIELQNAPTSPNGVLILYEPSPKDGSPTNELVIPLAFEESIVSDVTAE